MKDVDILLHITMPRWYWNKMDDGWKRMVLNDVLCQTLRREKGMECGSTLLDYSSEDIFTSAIKGVSVPCRCGDPNHWIVKLDFTDDKEE